VQELTLCKSTHRNKYVCPQNHPVLFSYPVDSCAVKMLQAQDGIPKECETRTAHLVNKLWMPLQNNTWLYFAPVQDTLTILCRTGHPLDVNIASIGKLSLQPGCKGHSVSAILYTDNARQSN
jgi:Protein of unknown function (DUF3609).